MRLRSVRLARALSQDELSTRSGVTKATISRIENDRDKMRRHPNMATVRDLAATLGVNPGWLLTGQDDLPAATTPPPGIGNSEAAE